MIIIPDIHGRTFWKESVRPREHEDIIFLGDYLDPYSYEGITPDEALDNFLEILDFKHTHPDNVTLLLGNHDLGYLDLSINICRHDFDRHDKIAGIFTSNADSFSLCATRQVAGSTYLFSHSFLSSYWLEACRRFLHLDYSQPSEIAAQLNRAFIEQPEKMYQLLALVSQHRGGDKPFGSIIWSDLLEVKIQGAFVDGIVNVFGHTQIREPLIYRRFACLDCKEAFLLGEDGQFTRCESGNA